MTNLNTSDFFDQEKKNGNGIGIIGMMNETEQKKVISSSELVGEEENVAAVFDANQALADCNKDIKEKELEISSTDNNNDNDTNDNEHFIINNNNQYIKNDNNNNNSTLRQRHVISLNNNNNSNNNNDTIVDRPNITNSNSTKSPLIDNLRTKELLSPTSGTFVSSSAGEGSSRGVRRDSQSKIIENNNSNSSSEYECNICFDTAGSPVLTVCGHLFCWPCLHQWLEAQSLNPLCPVCKAGCGQDKVIPIYGRGKEAKDPRKNSYIPNRPAGQRPRPQRDPNLPSTQFFPGLNIHSTTLMPHFSISVSTIFPAVFSPQITFAHTNGPPSEQQAFLSRILFMLGVLILICFYFN